MLNILPFIKPPKGWTVRIKKSLAVPRHLLHLSVIGLLVFTKAAVSHVEMLSEGYEKHLWSTGNFPFSWMWDKSHLKTSPWSKAMSSALQRILGHRGFLNFILFYYLRYKFRNSLKLCPYGLNILKTMAGFSLKDTMEFVDKIKDRRMVSPEAHRSYWGVRW